MPSGPLHPCPTARVRNQSGYFGARRQAPPSGESRQIGSPLCIAFFGSNPSRRSTSSACSGRGCLPRRLDDGIWPAPRRRSRPRVMLLTMFLKLRVAGMRNSLIDLGITPRLVTREHAALYCGLSPHGFSDWVKARRLPGPIEGTCRWDLKAIDAALDAASGLANSDSSSALDAWRANRARRAQRDPQGQ